MKPSFLIVLFVTISLQGYSQKINGVNFVAEKTIIEANGFDDLIPIHVNWIAWIPYAYCDVKTGHLKQSPDRQWKGETPVGTTTAIQLAKRKGLKVMLKPHVWLSDHSFTGTMELNQDQWKIWQTDFSKYILDFAKLAQTNEVELFCFGTEQYASIENDPAYWQQLIKQVREVYKGKITYAANWDAYKKCTFWKELDLIGIDAYMPISKKAQPTVKELERHWTKWKKEIHNMAKRHNKNILFTEFGYRTTEYTTTEPWKGVTEDAYCESCQADAFQAVFNSFWSESWFAGGLIWKWFEPNGSVDYENTKSYFVKGKLAEKTISNSFKLYKD